MLSLRSGIIIGIVLSAIVAVWGLTSWFDGKIESAESRGAMTQVNDTNEATNKVAIEGEKHAKDIDNFVDSKPITDVDRMLKSFPVTTEDGSTSIMSTMGTYTDDSSRSGEVAENESNLQTRYSENSIEDGSMDGKVHETCPTVVIWDDVLDMYIPIECKYDDK